MIKLDAAEELAKAVRLHLAVARNLQAAMGNHGGLGKDDVPRFEEELGRSFPRLERFLDEFDLADDWMLLEGEETRIQCLRCLTDCDMDNDNCPKCGNEFDGVDEYRDHAPFIDLGDIEL